MRYLLTSLLCVFTLSLTAQEACPNPYDGNGDGNVSIGDFLEMLAVFGDTDTDSDGVWDSLDACVDLAACNYANDPSEPCTYIDVLGVCGGGCEGDGDDDGICDSEDDCVGVLDECGVCNGPGPTEIVIESITILYDSVYLPQLEEWYVYEFSADTTFSYTCAPVFNSTGVVINELDVIATEDNSQFIELYGAPNLGLEGLTIALVNSSWLGGGAYGVEVYSVIPLNGMQLDSDGFLSIETDLATIIGAVAIYEADVSTLIIGEEPPTEDIIDALVYGNVGASHPQVAGILQALVPVGTGLLYEGEEGNAQMHSISRLPDGGAPFDISSYTIQPSSPGVSNILACGFLVSHEGYDYSTVQIGEQCWFAENCRYLPSVSPSIVGSETDPYYYVYGYEGTDVAAAMSTSNYATYGVLYNWPAVMTDEICPSGWHIPSDEEFTELTDFLGGEGVAGGKMKEAGYDHWNSPNTGATNSSGWTGLPGGYRNSGGFYVYGYYGYWWSASESGSGSWERILDVSYGGVGRGDNTRNHGYSARCVIDYTDECGVLNGDNSTCADCCGVPNGDGSTCDGDCGACNDNTSCLDDCGVPNGDNSTCFTNCGDDIGHEGYDYSTVQIGNQCWFAENCRYLPEVSPSSAGSETSPYYYVYGYEGTDVASAMSTSNYETYGVLYNWPAVMTVGICPSGWHIPSDGEWQTMEMSLGMSEAEASSSGWRGTDEGLKMKDDVQWNGSNSSGFTALPGGYRYSGGFNYIGDDGYWWSASESGSGSWTRVLLYDYVIVYRDNVYRGLGFSARCVRD